MGGPSPSDDTGGSEANCHHCVANVRNINITNATHRAMLWCYDVIVTTNTVKTIPYCRESNQMIDTFHIWRKKEENVTRGTISVIIFWQCDSVTLWHCDSVTVCVATWELTSSPPVWVSLQLSDINALTHSPHVPTLQSPDQICMSLPLITRNKTNNGTVIAVTPSVFINAIRKCKVIDNYH